MAADSLLNLAGAPPKDVTWEDAKATPLRYGADDPPVWGVALCLVSVGRPYGHDDFLISDSLKVRCLGGL